MTKTRRHRRCLGSVALFVLSTFVAFLCFYLNRSLWLDDWDSVQFAFSMDGIDLAHHLPHPPGYIAYIFVARAFATIAGDNASALILLSCMAGAVSVGLLSLILTHLVGMSAGIVAGMVLLIAPAHFEFASVAMADVVVGPFLLGAILLIVQVDKRISGREMTLALGAGLLLGWAAGIRPQALFVLSLIALIGIGRLRRWSSRLALVCSGLIGIALWLIPISITHGGLRGYVRLARGQFESHSDVRFNYTIEKATALMNLFLAEWGMEVAALMCIALILVATAIFRHFLSDHGGDEMRAGKSFFPLVGIAAIWFLVAFSSVLTFHPADFQRVVVPLVYPFAGFMGLAGSLCYSTIRTGLVRSLVLGAFFVILTSGLVQVLNHGRKLHQSMPPPVEAAEYVRTHFDPDDTLAIARDSIRHWQYYLRDFSMITPEGMSVPNGSLRPKPDSVYLVADYRLPLLELKKFAEFERSWSVYPKHTRTTLYGASLINERVLLEKGFYDAENWGFWAADRLKGVIRGDESKAMQVRLDLKSAFGLPRNINLLIDGVSVWEGQVGADRREFRVPVDIDADWHRVELVSDVECMRPIDVNGSADARCLALGIYRFEVVLDDPEERVAFFEGNHQKEPWGFWIADSSRGAIRNPTGTEAVLTFAVKSAFGLDRLVSLMMDGEEIWSGQVSGTVVRDRIPVRLSSDWVSFELKSDRACETPVSLGTGNDPRCLAIGIQEFDVEDLPESVDRITVEGFHNAEATGVWITDRATLLVRKHEGEDVDLMARIRSAFGIPRQLEISIGAFTVWSGIVDGDLKDIQVPVVLTDDWNRLVLSTGDGCISPAEAGHANDGRCLAFWIEELKVIARDQGPVVPSGSVSWR